MLHASARLNNNNNQRPPREASNAPLRGRFLSEVAREGPGKAVCARRDSHTIPLRNRWLSRTGEMATWGDRLLGRRPRYDDGNWKALEDESDDPSYCSPNVFNSGRIMWYNIVTHEHRWKELQSM